MKTENFILFPILHDSLNRISLIYHFRRIAFVHETGLAIVYGLIMGAIIRFGVQEEKEVILKLLFKLHHKKLAKLIILLFIRKSLYLTGNIHLVTKISLLLSLLLTENIPTFNR